MQNESFLRRSILPSVARRALPYFSTLPHTRYNFRKIKILNTKCVFFSLQLSYETFLILRRIQRDMIMNLY